MSIFPAGNQNITLIHSRKHASRSKVEQDGMQKQRKTARKASTADANTSDTAKDSESDTKGSGNGNTPNVSWG